MSVQTAPKCSSASRRDLSMRRRWPVYVEVIPSEYSSGDRQRLGKLTKQGNPFPRYLWCEAAIHAVGRGPTLGRFYRRSCSTRGSAKRGSRRRGSSASDCGFCLRDQIDYEEFCRRAPSGAAAR